MATELRKLEIQGALEANERGNHLKTTCVYTAIRVAKSCFRCGGEFLADRGRLCSHCRKPRLRSRTLPVNRNLSFREKQIVELVSEAKLNKQIAFELHLTEGTIKEYLNKIYRKLELKNRTELALWAVRNMSPAA